MYSGPERRDEPPINHVLENLVLEVQKNGRLLRGEGNGTLLNKGVVGALVDLCAADQVLALRIAKVEKEWGRFKYTLMGFAAGGGVLGGLGFDLIRTAMGN